MSVVAEHLRNRFVMDYTADVIDLIQSKPGALDSLTDLDIASLVQLAERADGELLEDIFHHLSQDRQVDLLQQSSVRTGLRLLKGLDETTRAEFLDGLTPARRDAILSIEAFPEDMAGHYTDSIAASFSIEDTVDSALDKLKRSRANRTRSVYVVDDKGVLRGRFDDPSGQPDESCSGLGNADNAAGRTD